MNFDRQAITAFIIACVVLAVSGIGFRMAIGHLNVHLRKLPVDLREHFSSIPRQLGDWRASGIDQTLDATTEETLGTDLYLDRWYVKQENGRNIGIALHMAYYTGMIDAIPHVPDRCMVAGGFTALGQPFYLDLPINTSDWEVDEANVHRSSGKPYPVVSHPHRITGRPQTIRMPVGDFRIRTTEFRHPGSPNSRIYAGFFFIANGQVTANPYNVRALAFDLTDRYAYYCKVQFTMDGGPDMEPEEFAARVAQLAEEVLPEIMRCLPDWLEVESRIDGQEKESLAINSP